MATSATDSNDNTVDLSNPYDNPLFLPNSDYSGLKLTGILFNGRNFRHWKKSMLLALATKNKDGFLTGLTSMPAITSSTYSLWWRCDSMVRCWLVNSMEPEFRESFMTCKTAKQLWDEVSERYGETNGPLLFQLKKDLRNITQENSSVAEYFCRLKRYWDEIEEIEDFPDCTCGVLAKCTCNLMKKVLELASREKVLTFLMGLSDSYDTLKSQILSMEPMPPINKAYSIVQQIESQKKVSSIMNSVHDTSALYSNKPGGRYVQQAGHSTQQNTAKKPKNQRWCTACNKSGHTRDTCFILHPEQKAKYLARFSGNAHATSDDEEHPLCPFPSQLEPQNIQASSSHSHSEHKEHPMVPSDLAQVVFQQVMQMLQSQQGAQQGASTSSSEPINTASINFAGPCF